MEIIRIRIIRGVIKNIVLQKNNIVNALPADTESLRRWRQR